MKHSGIEIAPAVVTQNKGVKRVQKRSYRMTKILLVQFLVSGVLALVLLALPLALPANPVLKTVKNAFLYNVEGLGVSKENIGKSALYDKIMGAVNVTAPKPLKLSRPLLGIDARVTEDGKAIFDAVDFAVLRAADGGVVESTEAEPDTEDARHIVVAHESGVKMHYVCTGTLGVKARQAVESGAAIAVVGGEVVFWLTDGAGAVVNPGGGYLDWQG